MREPEVEKVTVPGEEPLCRVGIVLEEDQKTIMQANLPPGSYILTDGKRETSLTSGSSMPLSVKAMEGGVVALGEEGETLMRSDGFIAVESADLNKQVAPGRGMLLKNVVAGRGFHWQKEVDLVFPRRLEFFNRNDRLVVVNVLPMESYLACVVTSEMSKECPAEFIKAQATAARSWMLVFLRNKHIGEPFTICNDDCCQRYQGTTFLDESVARATSECSGMCLVTDEGYVCGAYYSKSCGGIMEKAENVFGATVVGISADVDAPPDSPTKKFNPVTEDNIREWVTGDIVDETDSFCSPNVCPEKALPRYLGAVDEAGSYFRWKVVYNQDELVQYLSEKAGINDIIEFLGFKALKRGNSGRIHELQVRYLTSEGDERNRTIRTQYAIRNALHEKFLFSSAFVWDYKKGVAGKIKKVTLRGAGWGHGVGLCQIGALGMSLEDYKYEDILKHYFGGTKLVKAY